MTGITDLSSNTHAVRLSTPQLILRDFQKIRQLSQIIQERRLMIGLIVQHHVRRRHQSVLFDKVHIHRFENDRFSFQPHHSTSLELKVTQAAHTCMHRHNIRKAVGRLRIHCRSIGTTGLRVIPLYAGSQDLPLPSGQRLAARSPSVTCAGKCPLPIHACVNRRFLGAPIIQQQVSEKQPVSLPIKQRMDLWNTTKALPEKEYRVPAEKPIRGEFFC